MRLCLLFLVAIPGLVLADCPPHDPQNELRSRLLAHLSVAPTEDAAAPIASELWRIWLTAPDQQAQDMLDSGMERREMFDFEGAEAILTALTEYCPDYAEGWNQRAFARFLRQDYAGALTDLDEALTLSPDHIAARSGKALTLMGLGRTDEAQGVLRDALDLNPWLPERSLLQETIDQEREL
ncbi:tetratricopeptide repeat protein [Aestuariibius insulae]|uniref:tetratricopeptide repeat protein n=1 Tax=Aestuariibius insulae TaxID=2058287 RepID=UPI00345EAE6A